ncbi:MAG: MobA/MobL family protein, partial [Oscillospiraceae bacterium]|nr:MobA/MobL family protein [Oscillospiraceae bacterium]
IYHLSIKIISRGKGKSAVAAAAYRAGEKITNEREGITHDYSRKRGIVHTEIMLPEHAPPEYSDRAVLWNAIEKIEKASNSQLAREIELALPKELTAEQNKNLVAEYCKKHFVNNGMVADIAIHDTGNGNPHAHVMLTMRPFNEDRTWGDKQRKVYLLDENGEKIYDPKKRQYKCTKQETTDWNDRANANYWREQWADEVNAVLERENRTERIDHRSHKERGLDEQPTVHLGVAASQMEKKGIRTERGNCNRKIADFNRELRQLKARLKKLDEWLKEEMQKPETPTPPSLFDVVSDILNRKAQKGKSQHYQSINNLKAIAKCSISCRIIKFKTSPNCKKNYTP